MHKKDIDNALEYIEHNLDSELNITEISKMYHYSSSHFNRMFLSEMGYSVTKYIRLRRIIRSSQSLLLEDDLITQLAFDYGFTNIDTYIRGFKSVYGITPTEYRKVKNIKKTHSEKEQMIMIYLERIKKCTNEERVRALNHIKVVLELSRQAHQKGLFSLEKEIVKYESMYLKKAVEHLVDGVEPEALRMILLNYLMTTDLEPCQALERAIYLEGILMIQQGRYPWEIRRMLISLLGEPVMKDAESFFELELDFDVIKNTYLERKVEGSNGLKLDKEFKDLDSRRLQRIIRECDLLILVIATSGVHVKTREKVLAALSVRSKKNFMELYQLLGDLNLSQLIDAQNSILETMKKLRLNNDI